MGPSHQNPTRILNGVIGCEPKYRTAICYNIISRSRNQETITAKLKFGRKDRSTSLPMFKKIDHINIVVSDLEAAKEFFLDLGFTVVKREMLEGEWLDKVVNLPSAKAEYIALAIPNTQTKLELIKYYTPEGNRDSSISMPNQIGFRHIALEVKDIENVVLNLKKKGITFFNDIQIYNNKKLCYFLGIEGIILEFAEYM